MGYRGELDVLVGTLRALGVRSVVYGPEGDVVGVVLGAPPRDRSPVAESTGPSVADLERRERDEREALLFGAA